MEQALSIKRTNRDKRERREEESRVHRVNIQVSNKFIQILSIVSVYPSFFILNKEKKPCFQIRISPNSLEIPTTPSEKLIRGQMDNVSLVIYF